MRPQECAAPLERAATPKPLASGAPLRRRGTALILPLLLLGLWQGASSLGIWSAAVLPAPEAVGRALWGLTVSGELFRHLGASFGRVLGGFGVAATAGCALGILLGRRPALGALCRGTLEFLRHVPPLALLPMLILWYGIGEGSKVAVIVLAAFFPVFLNTLEGIVERDPRLEEVGRSLGLPEREILRRIVLPEALPPVLVGLRLGLGYGWRSLIGAELIAAASGVGYLIQDAVALSRGDVVVAGILAMGGAGMALDALFGAMTERLAPWSGARRTS